jgi:beta-alanine--pyruvate transaminase
MMEAAPGHTIEFFHGYTWSAHPVACAAALATFDIYESEKLFHRAKQLSSYFLEKLFTLAGTPGITDIRGYGMLAGVDIDPGVLGIDGYELQKRLYDHGVHVKTTGNTGILAPPFVCERDELDFMVETIRSVIKEGK